MSRTILSDSILPMTGLLDVLNFSLIFSGERPYITNPMESNSLPGKLPPPIVAFVFSTFFGAGILSFMLFALLS